MSIALIVTIFLDFLIFYCDLFLKRYTYIYIFLYVVLFVQIFFHTCILGKVFGFRFHEALIELVSASLREVYYTFYLGHNRCLCKKTISWPWILGYPAFIMSFFSAVGR